MPQLRTNSIDPTHPNQVTLLRHHRQIQLHQRHSLMDRLLWVALEGERYWDTVKQCGQVYHIDSKLGGLLFASGSSVARFPEDSVVELGGLGFFTDGLGLGVK